MPALLPEVLDQAVADLQAYLRIDTQNPPGDVRPAVAWCAERLKAAGIASRVFASDETAGKLNLLARVSGSGGAKSILLINHLDVVPVEPERWSVPPFGGALKDGCLWGRGALDMKSMGIAELAVLRELKRQRVPLVRDVLWLGVCDEEVGGGLGAKWMVEHHWDQLDPEFVLDEGGGGSRGLLAAPDRVVFAPSVNEKQVLWLKLSVRGEGGHGSMPHGAQPTEILQQALSRLMAARPVLEAAGDHPIVRAMRERLGTLPDNRYTNAIMKHTITLPSFQAGVGQPPQVNVIPSEAAATLDCRLLPDVPVGPFLDRLRQALGDERVVIDVIYQPAEPGLTSSHRTQLFEIIEEVVRESEPTAIVAPQLLSGGTDSRFFRAKGAVAYGFEPMIITPRDLDLIHGHDERIAVDEFRRMVQMLYEVVSRLATRSSSAAASRTADRARCA